MKYRDRVKELRRVRAGDLKPHPKNWRTHSRFQRDVLKGVLADVGIADALLVRELADGTLQIVDGHLRASTTPSDEVPVLVLDLNDEEAEKVLLTHDPLASLAGIDEAMLADLLNTTQPASEPIGELFAKLRRELDAENQKLAPPPEVEIPVSYQIVIEVSDEQQQEQMYERFRGEGLRCRVLTL
ncbi:ParB N-terminal domain-containing protein [Botrimarina hoheduenensis]|uniref:ParB/Sulfiredoxin domain-containing protein n=1 Tax=Botrimarina hoheduenensis TaxID=2528000 RepID=A0A5C5WA53_9BACT|nr:ParB N-terminal domain-containing protein [Botrimarina hoheduenensis]TWT46502.1 hypothetical protein Pla111_15980 [Botrimarina hoheduenensis]